jgi:hypothetical protein
MVSRNLRQAHLLEVGVTKIPGDHENFIIVRPRGGHSLVYFAYTCDNDLLKWGLFTYEKGL